MNFIFKASRKKRFSEKKVEKIRNKLKREKKSEKRWKNTKKTKIQTKFNIVNINVYNQTKIFWLSDLNDKRKHWMSHDQIWITQFESPSLAEERGNQNQLQILIGNIQFRTIFMHVIYTLKAIYVFMIAPNISIGWEFVLILDTFSHNLYTWFIYMEWVWFVFK